MYIAFVSLLSIIALVVITGVLIGAGKAGGTEALGAPAQDKPNKTPMAFTSASASEGTEKAEEPESEVVVDPDEVSMLAKLIWGEARGVKTKEEKAAVVWCVLNRVDSDEFPDTVVDVVCQKNQFVGYDPNYPETEEHKKIAEDVLKRWLAEKDGELDVGRVLPKEYTYFTGDGVRNYFVSEWRGDDYWDWSLPSPYDD